MILFRPEHIRPIQDGRKTQTRRAWGPRRRAKPGSIHLAKTRMLARDSFARLEVLDVYPEEVLAISHEDAVAEGYESRDQFLAAFCRINHLDPADLVGLLVWVVKFRVVEGDKN